MSSKELKTSDKLFFVTLILGPAASYSVVYLFHILLAGKLAKSAGTFLMKKIVSWNKFVEFDFVFLGIFLLWYLITVVWAEDRAAALRYCVYILIAISIVLYTIRIGDTSQKLSAIVRLCAIVMGVQIVLATLEALELIRLPFSPYSPYQTWFGRQPTDLTLFRESQAEYIRQLPTGFFGNPNNLASVLVLCLPFALFYRKGIIGWPVALLMAFVIFMTGGRVALVAMIGIPVIMVFLYGRWVSKLFLVYFLAFVVLLGGVLPETLKDSTNSRVAEFARAGLAIQQILGDLIDDRGTGAQNSTDIRANLILNGLDALVQSGGLGVGAGGSIALQESASRETRGITSMHNFWIEILVEGGVVFAALFAFWYASLIWRLLQISTLTKDSSLRFFARSLCVGLAAFVLAAAGPSSIIYTLNVWLAVGIALAVIALGKQEIKERRLKTSLLERAV